MFIVRYTLASKTVMKI